MLEILDTLEAESTDRAVSATEVPVLYRAQGGVAICRTFRELYETAPATLQKLSGK